MQERRREEQKTKWGICESKEKKEEKREGKDKKAAAAHLMPSWVECHWRVWVARRRCAWQQADRLA
jgi:hypothetical protein